jgi:threonylcarbamoyladenosine tRNA methylthiotransferase MtaB
MRIEPGQLFFLATQGCKVNQYESQAIREAWLSAGLVETGDPALADIVLINSCAVTERAILDLAKLARGFAATAPKPWIAIAGCAVEADSERIRALPGVDEVVAQKNKAGLTSLNHLAPSQPEGTPFPALNISDYNRARAVLKVQDGCSHGCTYCIIPSTRGASVSREPGTVIAEAERLLAAGIRELSLCGINLRQYGRDLSPRRDFWDLLAAVDQALSPRWAGRARLRIGSLEPADLHAKALETLAASRLMCPHLHLSLQSGSPAVLRRMGRGHYGPDEIFAFLDGLKTIWPVFGLGADFITGFPGETDAHFEETLDVVARLPLTYAHVFPYSERPGTPAATFAHAVPGHLRRERAKRLREVVAEKRAAFLQTLIERESMNVILEDDNHGVNEFYVDCRVDSPVRLAPRSMVRVGAVGGLASGLLTKPLDHATQSPSTTTIEIQA